MPRARDHPGRSVHGAATCRDSRWHQVLPESISSTSTPCGPTTSVATATTGRPAPPSTPWPPTACASTRSTPRTRRACRPGSALSTGRFGIRNGAVNHGGRPPTRSPRGRAGVSGPRLRPAQLDGPAARTGMRTASISTFAERHSAYHFDAGFNEGVNLGTPGHGDGRPGCGVARRLAGPHGAPRTTGSCTSTCGTPTPPTGPRPPSATRSPDDPVPDWLTEDVRAGHWLLPGPHSAQEIAGFGPRDVWDRWPRQPQQARRWTTSGAIYDGYDTGVRFADHHVGRLLDAVDRPGPGGRHGRAGLVGPRREPGRARHLLRPPDGRPDHDPAAGRAAPGRARRPAGPAGSTTACTTRST